MRFFYYDSPPPPNEAIVTTWSATDKASFVSLSNGGLTAQVVGSGGQAQNARASRYATGKAVFEITVDTFLSTDFSLGIANANAHLGGDLVNYGGTSVESLVVINNGGYFGTASGGLGTGPDFLAAGSVIMVIVDTVARKVWFRKGDIDYGGNPVTGTGGIAVPTGNLFPFVGLALNGSAVTANFGHAGFTNTVPAGFLEWDDSSLVVGGPPTLTGGDGGIYIGYSRVGSGVLGPFGTLSSQPIAGQIIDYLATGPGTVDGMALVGNQSTTLLTVLYVNGIAWTVETGVYNSVADCTEYTLSNSDPNFVINQNYTISTSALIAATVFKGSRTFAQVSRGPRTRAQMYLGSRSFFP